MKLMPPISLAPAPTSVSITLATLVDVAHLDGDAVAGAVADDRASGPVRFGFGAYCGCSDSREVW